MQLVQAVKILASDKIMAAFGDVFSHRLALLAEDNHGKERHPHDLPCFGFRVRLHLTVRRFFCDNAHCPRLTIAESFPSLLHHRARRTQRLSQHQLSVALAVSAEEGRRLLQMLAMPISGDTLIQDIRRLPEIGGETPRALGIDDWALRLGQTYGTILANLESSRPIDLLASREAEAVICLAV